MDKNRFKKQDDVILLFDLCLKTALGATPWWELEKIF